MHVSNEGVSLCTCVCVFVCEDSLLVGRSRGCNNTRVHIRNDTNTGETRARRAVEEKLQAAGNQGEGVSVRTSGRELLRRGITEITKGGIGAMGRHPEESVLVDFGSVKSQKNKLNI